MPARLFGRKVRVDVFLSWSGERSKRVAQALNRWLPAVLNDVVPWFSDEDIQAGGRWSSEVGQRLEKSNFGIICLTRDNPQSPWILFEAGALSKVLEDKGHVCPYLLDIEIKDISGPLSQFQAKRFVRTSTFGLLLSFPIAADLLLTERFEALWPRFQVQLEEMPGQQEEGGAPPRPEEDILEELVESARSIDRRIWELHAKLDFPETLAPERRQEARAAYVPSPWDQVM